MNEHIQMLQERERNIIATSIEKSILEVVQRNPSKKEIVAYIRGLRSSGEIAGYRIYSWGKKFFRMYFTLPHGHCVTIEVEGPAYAGPSLFCAGEGNRPPRLILHYPFRLYNI